MVADVGLNAIEIGILSALNVAAITNLVPVANHWNSVPPPNATYPTITFQYIFSDRRAEGFSEDAQSYVYRFRMRAHTFGKPTR